jgi:hypothetical protein
MVCLKNGRKTKDKKFVMLSLSKHLPNVLDDWMLDSKSAVQVRTGHEI